MHVVITLDDCPIEVQVRTPIQDLWAQLVETAADEFGRGIRYGRSPENPSGAYGRGTVADLVAALMRQSAIFRKVEELDTAGTRKLRAIEGIAEPTARLAEAERALPELKGLQAKINEALEETLENLKDFV